jgi:hypothetical protein
MSEVEVTNSQILETMNTFAGSVDERFDRVENEISSIKGEISGIKAVMVTKDELQSELSKLATKDDLDKLKTTMVTKGYLDDKLADHHSDIILHTQREIQKALG